ncbi:MAG TPA: sulfotransferase [Pyrinomonadaceae bacterium]|nr:sulfotransferase [Pyrinomonadaceae bacterium]
MRSTNDIQNPVFIAGYPRSGTTLLYRFLAGFREFGVNLPDQGETDRAFEPAVWFFSDPTTDLNKVYAQEWPHWKDAIPDSELFKQHVVRYSELGHTRVWWEKQLNRRVFHNPRASPWLRTVSCHLSRRRQIVRNFLTLYAQSYQAQRPLDKCPDNYKIFHELRAIFPQARFLFIYRHPLDVYSSMIRRARAELQLADVIPIGKVAWLFITPEEFAEGWLEAFNCATEFSKVAPKQLLMVRYEDFTNNREREAQRICEFLDLNPQSIEFSQNVSYDASRKFPLVSATPVPNSNKWQGYLHPSDINKITSMCAEALAELHYQ